MWCLNEIHYDFMAGWADLFIYFSTLGFLKAAVSFAQNYLNLSFHFMTNDGRDWNQADVKTDRNVGEKTLKHLCGQTKRLTEISFQVMRTDTTRQNNRDLFYQVDANDENKAEFSFLS